MCVERGGGGGEGGWGGGGEVSVYVFVFVSVCMYGHVGKDFRVKKERGWGRYSTETYGTITAIAQNTF